ncbi:MAG: hypothetical protein ACR2I2_12980 [Bryobacteraceae bacterium]
MVHDRPISGNLPIDVPIADRSPLQAGAERFSALMGYVMLHGFVDESAALPWPGQAVNRFDRVFRQHNVETLGHGS